MSVFIFVVFNKNFDQYILWLSSSDHCSFFSSHARTLSNSHKTDYYSYINEKKIKLEVVNGWFLKFALF